MTTPSAFVSTSIASPAHPFTNVSRFFSPTEHWARFVTLLMVLCVARGVVVLCVLPPFEAWDEYNHLAYADHMNQPGAMRPVPGETRVDAGFLRAILPSPQPAQADLARFGAVTLHEHWNGVAARDTIGTKPLPWLYQSQHPALYYQTVAPLYAHAGGLGDVKNSVSVLRLTNLLISATGLIGVAVLARRVTPDPRIAALIVGLVALQPLLLLNASRVANDALAVTLGWYAVALAVVSVSSNALAVIRAVLLGLVIGLAVATKATSLALVPFAVGAIVVDLFRAGATRPRVVRGSVEVVVLLACLFAMNFAEFRFNLEKFHSLTPMVEAVMNREAGRTLGDVFSPAALAGLPLHWAAWWVGNALWVGGWSFLGAPPFLKVVHVSLFLLAFGVGTLACARAILRRSNTLVDERSAVLKCVWLVVCVTLALSYHSLQSLAARGQSYTNPWYTAVGVPALLACAVVSVASMPKGAIVALAWSAALGVVYTMAETWGNLFHMTYAYTDIGLLHADSWSRLASLRPAWLGTPTLVAAIVITVAALFIAIGSMVLDVVREPALPR